VPQSPEQFVLVCDGQLTEALDAIVDEYAQKFSAQEKTLPKFDIVWKTELRKALGGKNENHSISFWAN